jgi:hypothetical protein
MLHERIIAIRNAALVVFRRNKPLHARGAQQNVAQIRLHRERTEHSQHSLHI